MNLNYGDKIFLAILLGLLWGFSFCTKPAKAEAGEASLTLGSGSVTGFLNWEVGATMSGFTSTTTSQTSRSDKYRDSRGLLWVARDKVRDTEKSIVPPERTIDIEIEGKELFNFSQDNFRKVNLATGIKISFLREKYRIGTATIYEYFDESEKIVGPIVDWEVAGNKVYVLNVESQVFILDTGSGQIEQIIPIIFSDTTGIAVEGERIYLSSENQISCYSLGSLEHQWTWTNRVISNPQFEKLEVRDGVIYSISDTQLVRIKVGYVDKKREVRQSSVVSTSKGSKIVDLAINDQLVVALDEEGGVKIYDEDFDLLSRYSFNTGIDARAIVMGDGNRLYVLDKNNRIAIYEFCFN